MRKEKGIVVDCITLQSKDGEEVLDLSFSEYDMSYGDYTADLRLKNEESATFGLPESLENCFGNTEETYRAIRESDLVSIVIYDKSAEDESYKEPKHNPKVKYLMIEIGDKQIHFSKAQLKRCEVEFGNE